MSLISINLTKATHFHFPPLFVKPYQEGIANIKAAFHSDTALKKLSLHAKEGPGASLKQLSERIKRLLLGIGLLIPVVNIIIFVARCKLRGQGDFPKPVPKIKPKESLQGRLKEVLEEVEAKPELAANTQFLSSLSHVKEVIGKMRNNGCIAIGSANYNHLLHWHLTKISKTAATDQKIKEIWGGFLDTIGKKVKLKYPNGHRASLDISREQNLLEKPDHKSEIIVSRANSLSPKEMKEIREIESESFTQSYPEHVFHQFAQGAAPGQSLFLAKDKENKQTVGVLLVSSGHIVSLARRANAAGMGVARELFRHLAISYKDKTQPSPKRMKLEVRPSNDPAIKLYQEFGFLKEEVTPKAYYKYPAEHAQIMRAAFPAFMQKALG